MWYSLCYLLLFNACVYDKLANCSILSEQSLFTSVYSGMGYSWVLQHTLKKLPAGKKCVWTMGRDNS